MRSNYHSKTAVILCYLQINFQRHRFFMHSLICNLALFVHTLLAVDYTWITHFFRITYLYQKQYRIFKIQLCYKARINLKNVYIINFKIIRKCCLHWSHCPAVGFSKTTEIIIVKKILVGVIIYKFFKRFRTKWLWLWKYLLLSGFFI